ncbi:MAG TPA: hypothetical protein DD379_05225 [Cyanobacteria bacterium UBA11162]|nr:hypothetical protein [Cyanobacteria bacterium UBA11162]
MNLENYHQVSHFQLEGQFVEFICKPSGELKYLRIAIAQYQLQIKLAKELRSTLKMELVPGDRIQVWCENKSDGKFGKLKLKAYQIQQVSCNVEYNSSVIPASSSIKSGKILLCQKSGCRKRGGDKLVHALEQALANLGLKNSITIEKTGCQKRCKMAPNFVLMPGKKKYSQISPHAIAPLLEQHYLGSSDLEADVNH